MPEGDTVHSIANFLRPRLVGSTLDGGEARDLPELRLGGRRVEAVTARGKHLWMNLDDGTSLRSHLGMWGSWHVYARDESWRKPRRQMALRLDVGADTFVCFNAEEVELVRLGSVREKELHARLGPDLIADDVDFAALPARARELLPPDAPLADVLLDQRLAAGVGNVYKSEVLFLEGIAPDLCLADCPDDVLARAFETAATWLRRNVDTMSRVTRPEGRGNGDRLWVYGRAGLPCHRCGRPVRERRFGRGWRDTYWCPACQPPA